MGRRAMIRLRPQVLCLLFATSLLACGDDSELGPRVPAAVVLTPAEPQVVVGARLQLAAAAVDASGDEMPDQAVTFRSSDATVLTVDETGLLTSVGSVGSSLITAATGEISAEVLVPVVLPASAIVVNPRTLNLDTGEEVTLSVTVTDQNAQPVTDPVIILEGSNPSIVRVEAVSGDASHILVTGLDPGDAIVTLTAGPRTAEIPVTVTQHATSVAITPSSLLFPSAGGSQQATAVLLDRTGDAVEAAGDFTWASSDESVAVVGPSGIVTPVGLGSAVVTATIDTFTARLGVFVGTPPAGEMLARVPFPGARGLAVSPGGVYGITGLTTFASGALPDFSFTPRYETVGPLLDVAVLTGVNRAYVARQSGGIGPAIVMRSLTDDTGNTFPVSLGLPLAAEVSADDTRLLVGTTDGFEVHQLPFSPGLIVATTVGPIDKVTRHPLLPFFYASGANGVFEVEATSGKLARRFRAGSVSHALSPDGARLYTVSADAGIGVWNLETGARGPRLGTVVGTDLTVSADGRFLYVIHGSTEIADGSRLYIVDRASGALLREVVLGGAARRVEVAGDGTAVVTNEGEFAGDGWVDFIR